MTYVQIIFIVFILFVLVLGFFAYREKFSNNTISCNGICVFDLDNTITCGINNAKNAISICKSNNYKIAVNTARQSHYYSDINLNELGLTEEDMNNDFYHGENYQCSFGDNNCFHNSIADTKVKHLYTLSKKYNLPHKKIILFDDIWNNIEKANNNGFSSVYANHHICGLPDDVNEQLKKLITLNT